MAMTIMEMEARIVELDKKVVLSNCADERALALDEISSLRKAIAEAKHTSSPIVVPVKDAPTIGTKREQRLKKGKMRLSATALSNGRVVL